MAEMTTKVTTMEFCGSFIYKIVAVLFLILQLAAAERLLKFSIKDVDDRSVGLQSDTSQSELVENLFAKAEQGADSRKKLNPASSWRTGLENVFDRVFRLAHQGEKWPTLKLNQVRTILGIVLGGIGAALSSAGGLGGGGLFVPLFNLLLLFDAKTSAALSNFMILGGSVVNLCVNLPQRHPFHHDQPVIDFDVLLLMLPNMLLGISFGVILNVVLPAFIITASLAIVLGYMTYHSLTTGLKRWHKETMQNATARQAVPHSPAPRRTQSEISPVEANDNSLNGSQRAAQDSLTLPLIEGGVSKRCCLPRVKILVLLAVWFSFFAVQVLRGGKGGKSIVGIQTCGVAYWLISSVQIPLAVSFTVWTIYTLQRGMKIIAPTAQEDGYVLGPEAGALFPSMALVAGVLGGMLGIGGGMIINPLLLSVGMIPQVTAATCASMVFFSSSMSVIQYWLIGRIPVKYAVISAVLCAIFSWFGIVIVHKAIEKYNRASLIVFSVASVMGVSAVLMCGFGGWDVYQQYESGAYMGFHYPC